MAYNLPPGITVEDVAMNPVTVTVRTYRISCGGGHYDEVERWQCPECGTRVETELFEGEDECYSCGAVVTLKYRRMRERNY